MRKKEKKREKREEERRETNNNGKKMKSRNRKIEKRMRQFPGRKEYNAIKNLTTAYLLTHCCH